MKLIDNSGRSFLTAVTGETPMGNLLWVDQRNGNDSSGLRGRLDRPFLSLTAAKTAASSGDTVVVMPGTYAESDLAKNGVNWHFLLGSKVVVNSVNPIFNLSASMSFSVAGDGEFENQGSFTTSNILTVSGTAVATIRFNCARMTSQDDAISFSSSGVVNATIQIGLLETLFSGNGIIIGSSSTSTSVQLSAASISGAVGIEQQAGGLTVDAGVITTSSHSIYCTGGTLKLRARQIVSTGGGSAIFASGGSLDVEASLVSSLASVAIDISGSAVLVIRALEISANSFYVIRYNSITTAILTVVQALVHCKSANATHSPVRIEAGSNPGANLTAAVRLVRCTLIAASGTNSVSAATTAKITLYGDCMTDKALHANVSQSYTAPAPPTLFVMPGLKPYSA